MQDKIINIFNNIAPSYDKANRILSLGIDITWRSKAIKYNKTILSIKGIDPSHAMLKEAQKKLNDIIFIQAYAQNMPITSNSIDILSISYGIRNIINLDEALKEFHRVLKPGGILLILEFTKLEHKGFIAKIRDFYLSFILPRIGGLISKDKIAYKYLIDSIDNFLSKDELIIKLKNIGFDLSFCKSFSLGISTMFVAHPHQNSAKPTPK